MDVWLHFILSNLMLDQGHAKRMFEGEIAGEKHRSIISSLQETGPTVISFLVCLLH